MILGLYTLHLSMSCAIIVGYTKFRDNIHIKQLDDKDDVDIF